MEYNSISTEQARVLVNAAQVFEALEQLRQHDRRFAGSMHWKHISGRDYLYRGYSGGKSKSLGPRSAETETTKERFDAGKAEHRKQTRALVDKVKLHAGYIRVVRLNRFPKAGGRVVRAFQKAGIPHRVIGTNALYAYEVSAGVLFAPEHLATEDMDILVDHRQTLRIAAGLKKRSFLELMKKTDKSFRRLTDSPHEFAAVNDQGYRVELITQGAHSPMLPSELARILDQDDLRPVRIDSLKWFLSSPHYSEVVFDEQGMPLRIDTVDPRAFVLFKWFVSRRDDRHPVKRRKDAEHARVVAEVLGKQLRHLPSGRAIAKLFPQSIASAAEDDSDDYSL